MTYNYNLNNLRGLCIFLVLYIHTITFLFDYNNLNYFQQYIYSLSSLCVPLLFMLSGYLYYFSRNRSKRTIALIKQYFAFALITFIVNLLVIKSHPHFIYLFTFDASSIGYLWFIKILIYLQLVVIGYTRDVRILVIAIVMFFTALQRGGQSEIVYYSICYFSAFFIARYQEVLRHYMPRVTIIIVFLLPVLLNELYFSYRYEIVLFVAIAFIFTLQIKSNHESKFLKLYSNYSLEFLFFQYFVIEYLTRQSISFTTVYQPLILFIFITTIIVYIYAKFKEKFEEELSKI